MYLFYNEEFFHFAYAKYWAVYSNPNPILPLQPVTGCATNAQGDFGNLWRENLVVQNGLRCAIANPGASVAFQPFRYGAMIYVSVPNLQPGSKVPAKAIYILYGDGRVEWVEDTYKAGDPEPTPQYPPDRASLSPG
jgi:hypothetical protein